jgi:uncharacterized protein (DUF111 family)
VQGVPVKSGLVQHEATTPTGAAILVALVDEFTAQTNFRVTKTGYGIGQRDVSEVPNVLRVFLAEDASASGDFKRENALMLECNIDDMNPEWYDLLFDRLLDAGASDVFLAPVTMKKMRPANKLSVLCSPEKAELLKALIFENTTTIGIREYPVEKSVLERREQTIETELGPVRIKSSYFGGTEIRWKPEYNDLKALAVKHGLRLDEVEKIVSKAYED